MSDAPKRLDVLRPRKGGLLAWAADLLLAHFDLIFRGLRAIWPVLNLGGVVVVTRDDDVREVLLDNVHFNVEQTARLKVVMDGAPFMLELDDRAAFERDVAPMRKVVRPQDIPGLAERCSARAHELIARANGELEVVDFIRQITLDVICDYIGVGQPADGDLRIMAMRIYEYQVSPRPSVEVTRDATDQAAALRRHIDRLIARRKRRPGGDDVLGRCVARRVELALSDAEIRANLIGLVAGALPQLPIAAPQLLNQLFLRPQVLAEAVECARADDDAGLAGYVFEALRFEPMGAFLLRRCAHRKQVAGGTPRRSTVKEGALVVAVLQSAMKDPRRVRDPETFDPDRGWAPYLHFGAGMHTCFAEHINQAVIPAMLKPLLACRGLARAPGLRGKLSKRGFFPDELWVTFTPPAAASTAAPAKRRRAAAARSPLQPA